MASQQGMRVLQIGYTHGRAGYCTAIIRTSKWLAQAGCSVMMLCSGGELDELKQFGIAIREIPWGISKRSLPRLAREIRSVVKDFKPDVVHVHGRVESYACSLAGRKTDFYTLHNSYIPAMSSIDTGHLRRFFKPSARKYFVLDENAKAYMTRTFALHDDRVIVMPHGVDCGYFRPPTNDERRAARAMFGLTNELSVLYLGRIADWKQPDAVVRLSRVSRQHGMSKLRFTLVGDGPMKEQVKAQIQAEQVGDICTMHDWMDPLHAYWAADLLVLPSLDQEGFALVVAEAMACGCPVLRSRTGGFDLQIQEGYNGFGCGTPADEFIDKALEVLAHPARLERMRVPARQTALDRMSSERYTQRTIEAYESVVRKMQSKH